MIALAAAPLFVVPVGFSFSSVASAAVLEEIVVTARKKEESLQDVPVTVNTFTQHDIERYSTTQVEDLAKQVPNFSVYRTASGSGSASYMRGVGSSSISAAFDSSVAYNVDGVVSNVGRLSYLGYLDMGQIEVLKGPQSLFFGKSTTAGVVSISSNNPGDEFEVLASVGYETELDETYGSFVLSGPLTDSLGARIVVGFRDTDEYAENLAAGAAIPGHAGAKNRWRGEKSVDARLTLAWDPTDNFSANFKYAYSDYEDDGPLSNSDEICAGGTSRQSSPSAAALVGVLPAGNDDCKLNGNIAFSDPQPALTVGYPGGGVPFSELETHFAVLNLEWAITDALTVTSVTGYVDQENDDLDGYDVNAGIFTGQTLTTTENFSQELNISSTFDGMFNFSFGLYYADGEQVFSSHQNVLHASLAFGPDPVTGNGYDWLKVHPSDSETTSAYLAGYFDITEDIQVTLGARYTDEEKESSIVIPYVHTIVGIFPGFDAIPSRVDGLSFEDDNLSPEVSVNWHATDSMSFYASYREAFKSGGIDNSVLLGNSLGGPINALNDLLGFESEEVKGFEVGMKGEFLDGSLRVNVSAFDFDYSELQVQFFNATVFQFETRNAGELQVRGIEADGLWATPVEGFTLRGNVSVLDNEYTDTFVDDAGNDLDGEAPALASDLAASIGFDYEFPVFDGWRMSLSADARYNDGYQLIESVNPIEQDSFTLIDAALRLSSEDDRYELALIGENLSDEHVAYQARIRTGRCMGGVAPGPAVCPGNEPVSKTQDLYMLTSRGQRFRLQFSVRF